MIPQNEQGIKQWLDELEKHPLTAELRKDLAQKELAKRKEAARKIAALTKEHGFGKNRAIKKRYAGHNDFHRISNQKNNSMMTKRILAGYCIKAAKRGI